MYYAFSDDGLMYGENNLYLGNKMTGRPHFNTPWFDRAAQILRAVPSVTRLFNPVDHDREMGFDPMSCPGGTIEEAIKGGFAQRDTLGADWSWIAAHSDGMVAGPEWHLSRGTISEVACHQALGLPVWEYDVFLQHWDADRNDLYAKALPPILELGGAVSVGG